MLRKKKIPLRVCLGCQERKPKKELIRVVRTPEGQIVVDATGKLSGRGAYICPSEECLHKALKARRLEKSLKQNFSKEVAAALTEALSSAAAAGTKSKL